MRRIVKYEPNQTLRYCDECGARYLSSELVQGSDQRFRCRRFCLERTLIDVDRAAASVHRQREAPPPPFGQAYGMNQSWMNESDIFDFVVSAAPWPGTSLSMNARATPTWTTAQPDDCVCAGESILYLYNMVAQGKRPQSWLSLARTKIISLAEALLASQQASLSAAGYLRRTYSYQLGGPSFTFVFSEARAALAMLRAYQLTGNGAYLASAKSSATWLTNAHRTDLYNVPGYSVQYGTLNRFLYGAWPEIPWTVGYDFFAHASMAAIEFMAALIAVDGDAAYGDTQAGYMTTSVSDLLSTTIASALSFWSTPQLDPSTGISTIGFSAATPFDRWLPSGSTSNTQNTWSNQVSGQRNMQDVCWALRSLYAATGATPLFTGMYNWVMSATQNPATPTPADPPYQPTVANATTGSFSPTTGITSRYTAVASPVNANTSLVPSLFGCLAPNLDKNTLDYGKQNWGTQALRNLSDANQGLGIPAMYTYLGLSNQMSSATPSNVLSVVDAAIFGNVYRYQQSYTGI